MHRMCKIIHTDFKPENVVIGLKASEVAEIAKTGQLTSTKMQKNELLKKLNMKVAGTLPPKEKKNTEEPKSDLPSFRYQDHSFEGMSAKQRKNLKKKLNRKRKKMEQSQNQSGTDLSESQTSKSSMIGTENSRLNDEEEPDLKEIEIEDIAVGTKLNEKPDNQKKQKAANNAS